MILHMHKLTILQADVSLLTILDYVETKQGSITKIQKTKNLNTSNEQLERHNFWIVLKSSLQREPISKKQSLLFTPSGFASSNGSPKFCLTRTSAQAGTVCAENFNMHSYQ